MIGDTAFGGFAQLTLPVLVALYWSRTTRAGMFAGVGGAQLFYLAHVALTIVGVYDSLGAIGAAYYLGWTPQMVGIALSLVLTVGVSLVTASGTDDRHAAYFEGLRAD